MSFARRLLPWIARVGAVLGVATSLALADVRTGEVGPSLGKTPNGRRLEAVGRLTQVGNFPTGSALTRNGRDLWVVDSGHGKDDVRVMSVATGQVIQTLPLPGAYEGIAFSPDGRRAYVSGTPLSDSKPDGPTKGNQGDVIHVFSVDRRTGTGTELNPIVLPPSSGGSGRLNALPPVSGVGSAYPEGLAVSPNGRYLVVALNQADRAAVLDLRKGGGTLVQTGRYPCGVAFDHRGRAFVSNEYDGTLTAIDPGAASVVGTVHGLGGGRGDIGSHPEAMASDPTRPTIYVAVANRDLVDTVDTNTLKVSHLVSVERRAGIGAAPVWVAVAPNGRTLYAADSGEDAVAAISLTKRPAHGRGAIPRLGAYRLIGRIPTAAYPTSVQVTPDGAQLLWVAGKGRGSGPNPTYPFDGDKRPMKTPTNTYGTYVLDMLLGTVGTLPTPTDRQARKATALANKEITPTDAERPPTGTPVVGPGGGPSRQIKHVFFIVKENRTYDQLFGTDRRGDGDPALELFDDNGVKGPTGGITPNAHALTRMFPLIDHFYSDSEVSVDGHIITSSGYANDYVQKALAANYSGRDKGMDFGIYPVTFPPNDFIFDQAVKQGISFRNYGEYGAGDAPMGDDGRPTYPGVQANTDNSYPNNIFIGCLYNGGAVGNLAACTQDSGILNGKGTVLGSQSRFDIFQTEFNAQVAAGRVPTLNYMILPNDHTNGTSAGDYSPQAMVADNDLALGQIVDLISHSPIWSSTAIFVDEDDSQDGADHVDSHRQPAYVISPWARRGAVVHRRYDQYSMLRTVELIAGLHPLSLNDALATPMYDAFASNSDPNGTRYSQIIPTQSIAEVNTAKSPMAKLSDALPWNRLDLVPQEISDEILWRAVHGAHSTPPPPGPDPSLAEAGRAATVKALIWHHANLGAYFRAFEKAIGPDE